MGGGFEPPKASPTDLQSVPFDHSGTPPYINFNQAICGQGIQVAEFTPRRESYMEPAEGLEPPAH